jgi:hypothetical protein
MEMPQILFSKWFQWNERTKIENINSPGVYILAKFKETPKGNADPKDKHVVYVGETCDNSLKGRWYQFNRSAFQSKDGHSGGWTYNERFKDKGDDLFVAALPVPDLPENLRHLFIRYVERKLILEFALEYGSQPQLNRK